jgi:hypothetical protein
MPELVVRQARQEWEVYADHRAPPPLPDETASAAPPTVLFESASVIAVLKEALVREPSRCTATHPTRGRVGSCGRTWWRRSARKLPRGGGRSRRKPSIRRYGLSPRSAATEETIARAQRSLPGADLRSVSRLDKEARSLPAP